MLATGLERMQHNSCSGDGKVEIQQAENECEALYATLTSHDTVWCISRNAPRFQHSSSPKRTGGPGPTERHAGGEEGPLLELGRETDW